MHQTLKEMMNEILDGSVYLCHSWLRNPLRLIKLSNSPCVYASSSADTGTVNSAINYFDLDLAIKIINQTAHGLYEQIQIK